MKVSERDKLMYELLALVKNADTYEKRYDLYSLGESLMGEYRDLTLKGVCKKLQELRGEEA